VNFPRTPNGVGALWSHQADQLRSYAEERRQTPDVALELPTGSGKTLVGLLISEWRRRTLGQRVVYACPTKQFARQVLNKANTRESRPSCLSDPTGTGIKPSSPATHVAMRSPSLTGQIPRYPDPPLSRSPVTAPKLSSTSKARSQRQIHTFDGPLTRQSDQGKRR